MTTAIPPFTDVRRRVVWLQIITLVWMSIEAAVSLATAWHARSPTLFGFGSDSLVELLSAAVVLGRFRLQLDEARAAKTAGILLLVLAGFVVLTSVLNLIGYGEAKRSLIGIVILLAAAVAMPVLARQKRKLAAVTPSASLKADAAESALCGYMAWIALAGLAVNAISGSSWADPLAALVLTPFIFREGWETVKTGRTCCQSSR